MGKFSAFKLHLKGMSAGVQHYDYSVGTEFFCDMESAEIRSGSVAVGLDVKFDGDNYVLDFTVKGTIAIPCDRCLDDMEHEVDADYHIVVKYGDDFDETDEVLTIPEKEADLNVAYMIYDTIALSIPIRHVHPAGQCNKEMATRLKRHSAHLEGEEADNFGCDDEETDAENGEVINDPRWDALRNLLDNK